LAIWKKNNKKEGKYNPPDSKLFKEIEKERGTIPSIISEGSEFKGNIKTSGEIQIDGVLNGNVRAKQIVVGVNGNVRGNVTANFLRICGKIEGEIRAETLEIVSSATVKGNVFKKTISIESGSKVTGNINELESTTAKIFKLQRKSPGKDES
jgi:cytoskeletal protein CcmA (bactofilin family)